MEYKNGIFRGTPGFLLLKLELFSWVCQLWGGCLQKVEFFPWVFGLSFVLEFCFFRRPMLKKGCSIVTYLNPNDVSPLSQHGTITTALSTDCQQTIIAHHEATSTDWSYWLIKPWLSGIKRTDHIITDFSRFFTTSTKFTKFQSLYNRSRGQYFGGIVSGF